MRLFRIIRTEEPTEDDFKSRWDLGSKPPSPKQERTWRAVSTFTDLAKARDKAAQFNLGDFIAELEVPDTVQMRVGQSGHVDLENTTPGELLAHITQVVRREARVEA